MPLRVRVTPAPWKLAVLALAAVTACDRAPAVRAPEQVVVPPPRSVSAPAAPADAGGGITRTAWWPDGTRHVVLRWVVHPGYVVGSEPRLHIDLVAHAGGAFRSIGIDARFVTMFIVSMQPACDTRPEARPSGNVVAELYLNGGGNVTYTVERAAPGRLELYENASSDGLCTDDAGADVACPVDRKLLGALDVPEGATFEERFAQVERADTAAGPATGRPTEVPLTCDGGR